MASFKTNMQRATIRYFCAGHLKKIEKLVFVFADRVALSYAA